MKRIIFIALILIQSITIAQNTSELNIYESPVYKDEVKTDNIQSIYTSELGKTGIVRNNDKYIIFDMFDDKLRPVHSKSIRTERKESYIGDIFYNNEIKVFTKTLPYKDKKVLLSCYVLSLKDKTDKKIELSSTTIDRRLSLFSNKKGAEFSMSPNYKYFSITNYTIHRDEIYFHVSVFDSTTFDLIYDKQTSRKENRFYSLSEIKIDNNQNVFVLGESFYDETSPKLKSEENRHFIIEKFSTNNYSQISLNLENKYIKSLKAVVADNQYNLYGFYSDSGLNAIKGVCNILIDMEEFKIVNKNSQDLPSQVYADLFGTDSVDRKKGKELFKFNINYILNDSHDNVYLLAEQYYVTSYLNQIGLSNQLGGNKTEHYDDIIIIKFDNDGKLDWGRSIYKYDFRPSYNAFLRDDDLHLILNSGKNLKELDDGRTITTKGVFETSALYDFVYTTDGTESIQKIQNNKDKTYYLPNYGNYVNGKFIMISDSRKERRFMTLE